MKLNKFDRYAIVCDKVFSTNMENIMRIKIEQWEVLKAVELYFKNEYGVDCDLVEGLQEWPLIDYQERVHVTKKHKNGKVVKNEYGHNVIDHSKTTYKKASIEWSEFDSITFFLPAKS